MNGKLIISSGQIPLFSKIDVRGPDTTVINALETFIH